MATEAAAPGGCKVQMKWFARATGDGAAAAAAVALAAKQLVMFGWGSRANGVGRLRLRRAGRRSVSAYLGAAKFFASGAWSVHGRQVCFLPARYGCGTVVQLAVVALAVAAIGRKDTRRVVDRRRTRLGKLLCLHSPSRNGAGACALER